MLTPHFKLSQDAEFVYVKIWIQQLRPDDGEFHVEGHQFRFYMRPYFLRLTFQQRLKENGRERAEHDSVTGLLTVRLPKEDVGEYFQGLNMITELLRKSRSPVKSSSSAKAVREDAATTGLHQTSRFLGAPLIEVLSSTLAPGQSCGDDEGDSYDNGEGVESDGEDMLDPIDPVHVNELLVHDAELEQELNMLSTDGCVHRYGFNAAYSKVFTGLDDAELLEISSHESIPPKDRRALRLRAEAAAFDPDHYMADFMEDAAVNTALDYTPWWRLVASEQLLERANGATAWGSSDERCEPHTSSLHGGATAAVTDAEASANADSWCCIGSAEQEQLLQLPRKDYLMGRRERRVALCGLIDILFAYCYDVRTTAGEASCESGWTIRKLSSQLSWLENFDNVRDAAVACVRRSLCYPLLRHWELALAVLRDVLRLLELGRVATLRALLRCRQLLQTTVEYGFLLNRIWVEDYCIWLQQQPPRRIARLAASLRALELRKSSSGWPLEEYESLAETSEENVELDRRGA